MVVAAAHLDGIFFKYPHIRGGFPGIQKLCAASMKQTGDGAGVGGDAAHPLQVVEGHPLTGKQSPDIAPHHSHPLAVLYLIPVLAEKFHVQQLEHPLKNRETGDDSVLFADQFHLTLPGSRHDGIGGNVLAGDILLQCLDQKMIRVQCHGNAVHESFSSFPY